MDVFFKLRDLRSTGGLEESASGDDDEEEKRLSKLAAGSVATFVAELLEIVMKLSTVDLKVCYSKKSFRGLLNIKYNPSTPRIMSRTRLARALWAMTISKPFVIGRVFVVTFSTLLLGVAFSLLYKHDRLVRELELSIADFDSRPSECVSLASLSRDQQRKWRDLEDIKRLIRKLGIILTNLPGQGVINLGTVGMLPLSFFFLSQLLLRKQVIPCDLLCFLFWPQAERRRVINEIHQIIHELVMSIKHRRFLRFKPKTQLELVEASSWRQKREDLQFMQLLRDIDTYRWVRPISVSSRWYEKLTESFKTMMRVSIVAAIVLPVISSISLVSLDIAARTSIRREQMKCVESQEDGLLLKVPDDFKEFSREEREAYANHDGTLASFMHLFLNIEASHYFSPNTCIFITCYMLMIVSEFFWGTFFVNTFIFASMDKVVWIHQLDDQIDQCLRLARARTQRVRNWSDQEYQQLIKLLTVSYLNFELFRRQYKRYIPLAKFFLSQGSLLALVGSLLFYYIGTNIKTNELTSVYYTCAAVAIVINIYLMAASVVSKKMERIMGNVSNLLAHLRNSRMIHAYPVELWRRQALTDKETRAFYGLHLFGRSLSYKDLISFNLHVIMLVLILMKINHKYTAVQAAQGGSSPHDWRQPGLHLAGGSILG